MAAIGSVCVYCGSSMGASPRYREVARALGRALAAHGIRLIFGGGGIGLMGEVADAVMAAGGQAIGVIPDLLQKREKGHRGITELCVVASMHERKNLMFELSDAFVILPGGFGTLDEAFEMMTWRQLGMHDKPILFLNMDGYWDPLDQLVDHFIREGFVAESGRRLFAMATRVEDVIPMLIHEPTVAVATPVERL
ncbi:MAG: TIGR00730 family Rossman fold protein [Gemmataceae bacterium]|nr:TIGR00730 family Rossman fold protein [Gemmataceae bacterium]